MGICFLCPNVDRGCGEKDAQRNGPIGPSAPSDGSCDASWVAWHFLVHMIRRSMALS